MAMRSNTQKDGAQRKGRMGADEVARLLELACQLGQQGLTLEEILAEWNRPPLGRALTKKLEAAVARGWRLGAASIKKARHQAALKGNVSAQAHQLALLQGGGRGLEGQGWEVVREVAGE